MHFKKSQADYRIFSKVYMHLRIDNRNKGPPVDIIKVESQTRAFSILQSYKQHDRKINIVESNRSITPPKQLKFDFLTINYSFIRTASHIQEYYRTFFNIDS